jgi:hypothetical protein
VTRFHATPRRFRPGAKRGTRLTFRLARPGRVVFVVRGPAPSCAIVGRFSVRGHRGVNRVRFKGKVGRRTLRAGTYAITAHGRSTVRRVVVVVLPRRGEATQRSLECSGSNSSATGLAAAPTPGTGPGAPGGGKARKAHEHRSSGVLPAIERKVRSLPHALPKIPMPPLPAIGTAEPGSGPWLVGILALVLLGLSGLGILAYVIRFIRKPRSV